MTQYTPEELIFIDESAAQERTGDRKYGWSPIGETPYQSIPFHRSPRFSILPALTSTGYLHPLIYHDSINAERFAGWLEHMILPHCNAYIEGERHPRSVIVMDNCRIHKTKLVTDVLSSFDVKVIYLPPYSPDFNPIELDFVVIKSAIRRYRHRAEDFLDFGLFLMWIC